MKSHLASLLISRIYSGFKEFYSGFKKIYSGFLDIAVLISSVFFILRLLVMFFVREKNFDGDIFVIIISLSIAAVLLIAEFGEKHARHVQKKSKNFKKVNDSLKILGSIIFSFLFINVFLEISHSLNEQFFGMWRNIEIFLNIVGIALLFFIAYFLIGTFLFFIFIPFTIFSTFKNKEKINQTMNKILPWLISFILISFIALFTHLLVDNVGKLIYNKIGWIFYFSLIFIHLNYLIARLIALFKEKAVS